MKKFDEKTASPDEIYEYYMVEYKNKNFLVKYVLNNFFKNIKNIISKFDRNYRLLEVGCGAGESSRRISSMLNGQYFECSEYDNRNIIKLKEIKFPIKITQESVYELKRKDNEFDCIFLLEVLEHLENPRLALKELLRVSRKYVVISVPYEPIWSLSNLMRLKYLKDFGNTPGHINHWSPKKLKNLLSKFGTVRRIYTPLPWIIGLIEKKTH